MADAVLDFLTQLGKALVVAFRNENRVVAEAFRAVLLGSDRTVYDAVKLMDFLDAGTSARTYILLLYVADNGTEASLSVLFPIQFSQQLGYVSLAVVVGSLSISGTMNARSTIQRLYLQSGIIGKAAQMIMVVNILCFLQSILFQCVSGFRNVHVASYFLQRNYLVVAAQDVAYFLQFMLVVGCKYYLHNFQFFK